MSFEIKIKNKEQQRSQSSGGLRGIVRKGDVGRGCNKNDNNKEAEQVTNIKNNVDGRDSYPLGSWTSALLFYPVVKCYYSEPTTGCRCL